jgi:hypothetical protein
MTTFYTSFVALCNKGIGKHQSSLQVDKSMLDVDPLATLRKYEHEQLMLNRMELPIGSIKDGPLL